MPPDRQVVYALELLAGVRPGEAAALRWRHYDPKREPLGELLVAKPYNTRKAREKGTKTDVVKHVPVHRTLAAVLADWKLRGWPEMMGCAPEPDDLIVPLPPADAAKRRARSGEPFRGTDYSYKRWSRDDLPALGMRHRRHYDMRATFITLALEDGADADVLEHRVTHTKKRRSAFDGYDRGVRWAKTCAEVAKLRISRRHPDRVTARVTFLGTQRNLGGNIVEAAGVEGSSMTTPGTSLRASCRDCTARSGPEVIGLITGCSKPCYSCDFRRIGRTGRELMIAASTS